MQQTDRGQYKKRQPFIDLFLRSCLGKVIIIAAVTGLVMLAASTTVPSKAKMEQELTDDIEQCIEECQGNAADISDDIVRNTMSVFTHADSIPEKEMDTFWKHNRIEIYPHTFFTTAHLYNKQQNTNGCVWNSNTHAKVHRFNNANGSDAQGLQPTHHKERILN